MEAEAIILADPYTYKFLKSLTHSALWVRRDGSEFASKDTLAAGARALFSASARTSASNDTTAFHPETLDLIFISKSTQLIFL